MKRFGSKQVIISKHIEMLMQLPKLNDSSDLKQLRQLLDKTEAATRKFTSNQCIIWDILNISHACHNGQNTARVTSYFKLWYVRQMGLRHCDDILCGRIINTGKVCPGIGFRANAKVGSEGKTRLRIWISSRSNQGTSHFINVVFKPRRTTAEQRNVVYFLQRPSSIKQVCCCHWSWDKEQHSPTERTMFWLFKEWSHQ